MKLNKRVWLVIVPVIVLAYSGICVLVYLNQKQSYLSLEQSRLESTLDRLQENLINARVQAAQFTSFLLESATLQEVMLQKSNMLSVHAAERNLNQQIQLLVEQINMSIQIGLLNTNGSVRYRYSSAPDPFFTLDGKLLETMSSLRQLNKNNSNLLSFDDNRFVQRSGFLLDPFTMKPPTPERRADALALGFQVEFNYINTLFNELESSPDYLIIITQQGEIGQGQSPAHSSVKSSRKLEGSDLIVHLQRNPKQIHQTLISLVIKLALIVAALTLATSYLLGFLIKRFVTRPVVRLESSLKQLEDFIPPQSTSRDDEVSSLGRTIAELNRQRVTAINNIQKLAETDALTELHNRRMFSGCVESILGRASHDDRVALFYIDLDNFKFVNDNYGHETGDQILKEFASALKSVLRLTDLVVSINQDISRLGGDEFAIIVSDCHFDSGFQSIAERILGIFENGFKSSAGSFPISASIGIAIYPHDGQDATTLITNADAAMYQAKISGKNQYSFFSQELADKARRQQQIEANLKMKHFKEFSLNYMPLVDAKSGYTVGVEALLRWNSKELGFVSPAEFIPIAESKGLFLDLDLWVLNRVIDDLPTLLEVLGEDAKISVNISSAQLCSEQFFYELMNVISSRKVKRDNLELEITETYGTEMTSRVLATLNLLKQAGFTLALDDFGAGYTSLLQLMEYPVDVIKIDKSLVDHVLTDGYDLVNGLVGFCNRQGFKVTAEGIEQKEQAEILCAAGVDILQGFYFGKPQTLESLIANVSVPLDTKLSS